MADREQTAAARVFSLPEILEYILLFLAYSAIAAKDDSPFVEGLGVLKTFAALQLVNTTFHDTIKASKTIQRLMMAPVESRSNSRGTVYIFGDIWLYMLGCDGEFGAKDADYQIMMEEPSPRTRKLLKSDKYRHGSWRDLRLKEDPKATFDVGFSPDEEFGMLDWDLAYFKWSLKGDATLGELVDLYFKMVEFQGEHDMVWEDGKFLAVKK